MQSQIYESRHNLNYWHYGNYIGIGPEPMVDIQMNLNE